MVRTLALAMIIQLRGGNGSGKSTTVRKLLLEHDGELIEPSVWRCAGDLWVAGSYRLEGPSPGVGGDRVDDAMQRDLVQRGAHAMWEGYTGSGVRPKDWHYELSVVQVFIGLTPEQQLANIMQRRDERQRNVGKPLNEERLRKGNREIARLSQRLMDEHRLPVVNLQFGPDLYVALHDLLMDNGWACPHHKQTWTYNWAERRRERVD